MESKKLCPECGHMMDYNSYFKAYMCSHCNNIESGVKTNYEKIMEMSPGQLAHVLYKASNANCNLFISTCHGSCSCLGSKHFLEYSPNDSFICVENIKKWLESESEKQ